MGKKLYVGNLPWSVTEDELKDLFGASGTVEAVVIIKDRDSGRSKGFGFVTMASEDEASKAINNINGQTLGQRQLTVNEAIDKPREPRENRDRGERYEPRRDRDDRHFGNRR